MKVIVVGGGVAGLSAALELRERGHEVTVLEREATAGGKVRSERAGAWRVEHGPAGVLEGAPDTEAVLGRLGLAAIPSAEAMRRRFVVREGRLVEVPDSPPKLLTAPALSMGEKWRLAREPFAPAPPPNVDETVAEFARRRLGPHLAAAFVEPFVAGIYAGDYERLSLRSALPKLAELERQHGSLLRGLVALERARRRAGMPRKSARLLTFSGGMGDLPGALGRALGDGLRTGVTVTALVRDGGRLTVRTPGGPLTADRVVLAVPPAEAAALLAPLDATAADACANIPVAGVAAVCLGYPRAQVPHPLDGFGFLVPRQEGLRLLGVIWMTSTFPAAEMSPEGHVLLRCMLGGRTDPEAVTLDERRLVSIARAGLRTLLGIVAEPAFTHVVRWPQAIAQYEVGHEGRVAAVETRAAALGIYPTGAAFRGVGVNDVIREGRAVAARLS